MDVEIISGIFNALWVVITAVPPLKQWLLTRAPKLLEASLDEPAIGQTSKFLWHATPIGIAALCKQKESHPNSYEDALKEGLEVGLDLSREERESHYSKKGLVILFYS